MAVKDTIKNFFSNLFKNFSFRDWLLLAVSVLLLFFFFRARNLQNELMEARQEYTGEITEYVNRASEEYQARQLAVLSLNEAKKQNIELAEEIKNLKDNPVVVSKIKTVFKVDTVFMETAHETALPDSTGLEYHKLNWSYKHPDGYYDIAGNTSVTRDFSRYSSVLEHLSVSSKMTVDLIDSNNHLVLLARSDNPYINVSDINAVVIDPRKSPIIKKYFPAKRWGIGPYVGFGVTHELKPTWSLGISLHYSIIQF